MYQIYELEFGEKQFKQTVKGLFRWELKEIRKHKVRLNNCFVDEMSGQEIKKTFRVSELFNI